jgi:hypothetical protein
MREHCRESSRNFPGRNGPGRAGPALVVARTGRAGPGGRRAGPKNFGPFSALIGSMGSAPHIREIYSDRRSLPSFLFFRNPTARMGIASWTIMPQLTQIFSRKCLLGCEVCKENIRGHICLQRGKNF